MIEASYQRPQTGSDRSLALLVTPAATGQYRTVELVSEFKGHRTVSECAQGFDRVWSAQAENWKSTKNA
jgi:hypothetical protein